jgi:hypothetical protein
MKTSRSKSPIKTNFTQSLTVNTSRQPSFQPHVKGAKIPEVKVKKNAKGGVLVTKEEIQHAFSMLDQDKSGLITMSNLRNRLGKLSIVS